MKRVRPPGSILNLSPGLLGLPSDSRVSEEDRSYVGRPSCFLFILVCGSSEHALWKSISLRVASAEYS